jgi:hypothetical protein
LGTLVWVYLSVGFLLFSFLFFFKMISPRVNRQYDLIIVRTFHLSLL